MSTSLGAASTLVEPLSTARAGGHRDVQLGLLRSGSAAERAQVYVRRAGSPARSRREQLPDPGDDLVAVQPDRLQPLGMRQRPDAVLELEPRQPEGPDRP